MTEIIQTKSTLLFAGTYEEAAKNRATYSPEDDKIRLYPSERLSSELYARVRGAGYGWAPLQKLFYAVWTPEREDLALELAGSVDDEDKSLAERAEERAERFTEYSANRKDEAEDAREAVSTIADNIPLGQPILVGHHSERAARKDAERIEDGMRKAVKLWETSQYWEDRAKGAIRNAKYKELPTVRVRRIKGLEADKRAKERTKSQGEAELKAWSKENLTLEEATQIANYAQIRTDVILHEGRKEWSAWSALDKGELTAEEVKAQLIPHLKKTIAWTERWINHYTNRLTYEKLLYGESGGIASDRVKPEIGGAVKCWVHNSAWLYIQKVNKVSVTVLDSWQEDDPNSHIFKRIVPFDQLSKVMSKAEVDEHRAKGELEDRVRKTGFYLTSAESNRERFPRIEIQKDSETADFEKLREQLKEGVKVVSAPQLFPTPPEVAARMRDLARFQVGSRVLEPSAGTGSILREIVKAPTDRIEAVEINGALADNLKANFSEIIVHCADFLEYKDEEGFDRILMNPPFEHGEDIKHIQHALELLKPRGRLVGICANGPRQNEKLKPLAETWEELPADTFKESGTGVNAVLLVIARDPCKLEAYQ